MRYLNDWLMPVTRSRSWPTPMIIRLPPGMHKEIIGLMPFSFTPTSFQPLSTWSFYQPSSPTPIMYTQHPFGLTHFMPRHGTMRPKGKHHLQVTKTLSPRLNMSGQWCNNRHKGTERSFLPCRQNHPPGRTPEVAVWNNL